MGINLLLILLNVGLAVLGQFLIKKGVNVIGSFSSVGFTEFLLKSLSSTSVLLGIFLYSIGAVVWVLLLSRVNLSFAYPMLSLGYILILFVSWAFLNETITVPRLAGVLLISVGIIFIFRS